jgi:ketosteroid isomerase-like protein
MGADANRALIERFYDAFDRRDGQTMSACYAPDARFSDPAFGELHGDEIGDMWRMLTGRAEDLSVELRAHDADEDGGSANWIATYTFGQSGRPVVNDIQARFRFRDGLIAEHDDDFDFRHWARQALGLQGIAVALLPPLRAKARQRARGQLEDFRARESAGGESSVPAS